MKKKGPVIYRGQSTITAVHLPTPLRDIRSRPSRRAGPFPYRKARRRIRRGRFRVFTNVRTATRNLDLPLAIRDPRSSGSPYVPKGGFGPVHFCHNGGLSVARAPLSRRSVTMDVVDPRYPTGN